MNNTLNKLTCVRRFGGTFSVGLLALLGVMLVTIAIRADDIRLRYTRPAPLRLTVSVNTTNSGVITNLVNLSTNIVGGVTLSVSNLPAGCGYDLATNGVSVGASVTTLDDVGLSITVNSTNLAQGEYTFYLLGTGGATNNIPFTLQSCYIWQGTNDVNAQQNNTYNWTNNSSWVGNNNPGLSSGNDVFFGDLGGQTNRLATTSISFTNIQFDQDVTVGSMRFGAGTFTNTTATNALFHNIRLNGTRTLTVNGTKGFSLLRDYIAEYGGLAGSKPDRKTGLFFSGGNSAKLLVTNMAANLSILLDGGSAAGDSFLAMTNIGTFAAAVNRFGMGDFQLYPNYRAMNVDSNGLGGVPRLFVNSVYLARTNYIIAGYKDLNNYTNANTRSHAIMWLNGETSGNGSSVNNQLWLGVSNRIFADSICFVGANHASGNGGFVRFNTSFDNNAGAVFRGTNGTSRMSVFTVSDGGGTNVAGSNIKANIDFSTLVTPAVRTAVIDILADRFYIARDRSQISESNTVNYSGTVMFGRGTVDVNTAILGYQEQQVRRNDAQPQLGYCQGNLTVTNAGIFKVNGQLTLGYTADTNLVVDAQQYNTYGRVTVNGATVIASNIVVDGGPRNYSHTEGAARQDSISLVTANLTVSNTIAGSPGQPLNSFTTERSTNVWFVAPGRTNLTCRTLLTPGTDASVIKVAGISGVASLPATLPIISYEFPASPYLKADMSSTPGTNGYLLNNTVGNSVDLYLTTNAPLTLRWTGSAGPNWDYTTLNWVPVGGGGATNFHIGDIAIFDDTAVETNVTIVGEVVPGQTGAGVTVSNSVLKYTFSGGTVAGTSLLLKVGTQNLTVTAIKQGPLTILGGSLEVGVGGVVGTTTVASNIFVNCLGTINGGLNSTGVVSVAAGGVVNGTVNLDNGSLSNGGTISTDPGSLVLNLLSPIMITNTGILNVGGTSGTQWTLGTNSVLANNGTINNLSGRLNLAGFMYGTGTLADPDGTGGAGPAAFGAGIDGRLEVRNPTGILSPGATATNSIGTLNVNTRFDFDGVDNAGWGTLLIEVDKSNPQTNDQINAFYWSNLGGKIIFRNINPGMPFANGDVLQVMTSPNVPIQPDNVAGDNPVIEPFIPGPGLVWDTSSFRSNGIITVKSFSLVWGGIGTNIWDDGVTANWQGGLKYTNNLGVLFDDTASAFTVNVISNLAPAGWAVYTNITGYSNGAITTNVVSGVTNFSTNILALFDYLYTNNPTVTPGIVVNNTNDYVFTGVGQVVGYGGIYKAGPGTLTFINQTNDFKGTVIIDEGTIVVSHYTGSGAGSPLGSPGGTIGNRQPRGSERLIIDGGTLRYAGVTTNTDRGMTIYSGNATLDISNSTANLVFNGNNSVFRGPGALTKTGLGTMTCLQSGSTYSNLTVNNGTVRLGVAAGNGNITLAGGTTLGLTNNISLPNDINVSGNAALDNTNTSILTGKLSNSGNLTVTNLAVLVINSAMTNYSGDITFVGNGTNRFNNTTNSNNARGSAATVFDLGASARLENFNGGDTNGALRYDLGGLAGGAGARLAGRATNNGVSVAGSIYNIGAKGVNTTFGGSIQDGVSVGTVSVVKVGGGILALNGINIYTGTTTVSNGTLGGSGSIAGSVTVASGGTIAPGNSVGTFTVSNNVTLGGATLMELNPAASDLLRVTGTLTGGGTLTVTNIGGTLTNGSVFTLFSQSVSNFTSTTLPAGYVWNNNIATAGTIQLVSGGITLVNTTPTNITSSVSGSTLTLSWPSDHTGWTLQTQTNALSVGLTTPTNTWFGVAGSSATNLIAITIDPTQPTVFFRLVYP